MDLKDLSTRKCEHRAVYREVVGWLVGLNGLLRQYFSLYQAVSQREGEKEEMR